MRMRIEICIAYSCLFDIIPSRLDRDPLGDISSKDSHCQSLCRDKIPLQLLRQWRRGYRNHI